VYSNSSDDCPARRLLGAAFDVLHDEAHDHHERVRTSLAALPVNVTVGDESLAPRLAHGRLVAGDPREAARVAIRTSLATVLALLDGRRTVLEAITRGELEVRGTADALDAAADAFAGFLHGLVRSPSSPGLLVQLRDVVGSAPGARP